MNASDIVRGAFERLQPKNEDATRIAIFLDMLRAERDFIPEKLHFTNADLDRLQRDLDWFIRSAPVPGIAADLQRQIDQLHHHRALWTAICALFDAPDEYAQHEAIQQLNAMLETGAVIDRFFVMFSPADRGGRTPEYARFLKAFYYKDGVSIYNGRTYEENQQGVNHETPDQFQQTLHRARR